MDSAIPKLFDEFAHGFEEDEHSRGSLRSFKRRDTAEVSQAPGGEDGRLLRQFVERECHKRPDSRSEALGKWLIRPHFYDEHIDEFASRWGKKCGPATGNSEVHRREADCRQEGLPLRQFRERDCHRRPLARSEGSIRWGTRFEFYDKQGNGVAPLWEEERSRHSECSAWQQVEVARHVAEVQHCSEVSSDSSLDDALESQGHDSSTKKEGRGTCDLVEMALCKCGGFATRKEICIWIAEHPQALAAHAHINLNQNSTAARDRPADMPVWELTVASTLSQRKDKFVCTDQKRDKGRIWCLRSMTTKLSRAAEDSPDVIRPSKKQHIRSETAVRSRLKR